MFLRLKSTYISRKLQNKKQLFPCTLSMRISEELFTFEAKVWALAEDPITYKFLRFLNRGRISPRYECLMIDYAFCYS